MRDNIARVIATLRGRVQTVGFRDRVLEIAERHPVAGTVRNLRERDRLEIDVEGAPSDVDAFLTDVLSHPPRAARVQAVERAPAPPRGATGFTRARTP